jgi:hypothetical protein
LPLETRVQILSMLYEGSSMRSVSRITGASINTVSKLLIDAGLACAAFHDKTVRGVAAKAVQCDEIWSFSYAKNKNVKFAKVAKVALRVLVTFGRRREPCGDFSAVFENQTSERISVIRAIEVIRLDLSTRNKSTKLLRVAVHFQVAPIDADSDEVARV